MLTDTEDLFNALNGFYPQDSDMRHHLAAVFDQQHYPRQHHLLRAGQIPGFAWFIREGSARVYYISEAKGEEVTTWFWHKGDFMLALDSFFRQVPTQHHIGLLEDSTLLTVSFAELEKTATLFPRYRHLERSLQEVYRNRMQQHFYDRAALPVKARFEQLMHDHPELFNIAPVKDIASFLGMFPDTLSRLRSAR